MLSFYPFICIFNIGAGFSSHHACIMNLGRALFYPYYISILVYIYIYLAILLRVCAGKPDTMSRERERERESFDTKDGKNKSCLKGVIRRYIRRTPPKLLETNSMIS